MFVFFFFSSRRRHTRSLCDWSSDVCSSDLIGSKMPNLTYMLVFENMAAREKNWAAFVSDPEWKRSEEHTSELQPHSDLVCRLLLEKKKKNNNSHLTGERSRNAITTANESMI